MGDFSKAVSAGVAAGATGAGIAGTAAAIGAAAGASFGPFAPIAAPIGAAVGAIIGFLVSIFGGPSEEERKAAQRAIEEGAQNARKTTALLSFSTKNLADMAWGSPASMVFVDQLRWQAEQNPGWKPVVDDYIAAVRASKYNPPSKDPDLQKFIKFMTAFGSVSPDLQTDPFVYLRPPFVEVFGPALAAAGINIADPKVIEAMRGNWDFGVAQEAKPRIKMGIPIARASLNAKSGGRIALDKRAFAPSIAPYGVGSYKLFPDTAPSPSWANDGDHGNPLSGPWPGGLDADNFAKPLGSSSKLATVVKVGAIGGIAAALIFFL